MTGPELWQQYQHYTRDLTEHGRKLGFAGAAICWVFRDAEFKFPTLIYFALLAFVAYFLFDILQALLGALVVRFFTEHSEAELWRKSGSIEGNINKPRWVDQPAFFSFIIKNICLCTGFVMIALELLSRLNALKN
ncbi:MAG: hypothetical protein KDM63_16000 [Verrucomicrobiae bacterium]|nr:hypothetical protein [Verrucomicrobiae bacterium]